LPGRREPPGVVALQEAANLRRLFQFVRHTALQAIERRDFTLDAALINELNRLTLEGLSAEAGKLRNGRVFIVHSEHEPPLADAVPGLLEEMCGYVNRNLNVDSAIHAAAYVMWRLAWIHPYADGNGRTSRAAGYLVLCVALDYLLPGTETILESMARNKRRYFEVLEDSDIAWRGGRLDVSSLERLIARYLQRQLASALGSDGEKQA
jgi:Fic family protein